MQGNLLLPGISNRGPVAIDRKTLQLQSTSAVMGVTSNGMLFVNTSNRQEASQRIMAVDLGQK